jgi:hypothetical protein
MSDIKHTPGPWHRNIPPASKYPIIFSGRNTHVAQVCVGGLTPEEIEANCNLISAAPDLALALAWVAGLLENPPSDLEEQKTLAIAAAKAAFAKAEQVQ